MRRHQPNFLFIGPDKSGSTWVYEALRSHPAAYLPEVKEVFFFDRFYPRGWDWYERFFAAAPADARIIGEISHDYLFSEDACVRIRQHLPETKLMVCLREPVERAFSAYLYMIRQGRTQLGFREAVEKIDELIDHGRYADHLQPYLRHFPREQLHVAVFDDLKADPDKFFNELCNFLEISSNPLPADLGRSVLPAAAPRWFLGAHLARRAGWMLRTLGLPGIVSKVKNSPLLNRVLYRQYPADEKPIVSPEDQEYLRTVFAPQVTRLDALLGLDLTHRWGYGDTRPSAKRWEP